MHAQNSILYLESQAERVSRESDTVQLDRIMPIMASNEYHDIMVPMNEFASSTSGAPLPEFYEQYPVYVEDASQMPVSTVYKIFDPESPEVDVLSSLDHEIIQNELLSVTAYLSYHGKEDGYTCLGTVGQDEYEYDKQTGMLTVGNQVSDTGRILDENLRLDSFVEALEGAPEGTEASIILEITFEKYRSISDLNGMEPEEVANIASMQAIQGALLEYYYHFEIGTQTQTAFSEIAYYTLIDHVASIVEVFSRKDNLFAPRVEIK